MCSFFQNRAQSRNYSIEISYKVADAVWNFVYFWKKSSGNFQVQPDYIHETRIAESAARRYWDSLMLRDKKQLWFQYIIARLWNTEECLLADPILCSRIVENGFWWVGKCPLSLYHKRFNNAKVTVFSEKVQKSVTRWENAVKSPLKNIFWAFFAKKIKGLI